jgi:UDP-N-acetylmuramoyl-L-alanyl-D-glutamate--2,6-diaminopimelate ligase
MSFRSLVKKFIPAGLFPAIEPYGHLMEAVLFNVMNGFPARGMKVIGVTGTNGKTSTAFMIHKMLQESGYKTGLMTTVAWGAGNDIRSQMHHYTNVPVPELMRRLKYMRAAKVDWLVMEITSQALAQNRAWGIPFSVAVMTNVTHEHLAYHRTFERYVAAKAKLFKQADRNRKGLRAGIVNAEDPSADIFTAAIKHPLTYGVKKGDIRATDVVLKSDGVSYETEIEGKTYRIKCHLPGSFNVYNSLAAVSVGHVLGLSEQQVEQGIAALEGVEGRMTHVDEGQDFTVIVDYAHSPDSFEKLFKDIKPITKGKLIVLFGSLGGGDVGKRAIQGRLSGEYADLVVVTEEDDRREDGRQIMEQITAGVEEAGKTRDKDLFLVNDRTEAIAFAIGHAKKDDIVLLLGKGHEKTIERADGEHPWDEIDTARKVLRKA